MSLMPFPGPPVSGPSPCISMEPAESPVRRQRGSACADLLLRCAVAFEPERQALQQPECCQRAAPIVGQRLVEAMPRSEREHARFYGPLDSGGRLGTILP